MTYPAGELDEVVDAMPTLWEELRGGRVLITGATGFFGSWLVQTFARANERLGLKARAVAMARRAAGIKGVETFEGDVRGARLPDGAFSHLIHAAATSSAPVEPLETASVIVDGTRRIVEIARGSRFLFVSSGAVYGPQNVPHVAEEYLGGPDPLQARNAYGEAKRLAELWSVAGANAVVARPFAFVGPGLPLDAHFAIGNFIADGLAKRAIVVKGDGTTVRSYLYASDLAIWLWTILLKGAPGRAYNVGSEEAVSIRELAHTIGGHFGVPVEVRGAAVPGKPVDRYVPSTRRAREELGLVQRVPLADAIRRTARWHEVNRR